MWTKRGKLPNLPVNIRHDIVKNLQRTNNQAYTASLHVTKKKTSFITRTPGWKSWLCLISAPLIGCDGEFLTIGAGLGRASAILGGCGILTLLNGSTLPLSSCRRRSSKNLDLDSTASGSRTILSRGSSNLPIGAGLISSKIDLLSWISTFSNLASMLQKLFDLCVVPGKFYHGTLKLENKFRTHYKVLNSSRTNFIYKPAKTYQLQTAITEDFFNIDTWMAESFAFLSQAWIVASHSCLSWTDQSPFHLYH